ncbi:TPA: DUF551 domain-containing protein [Escherichia coli]|nr:DUF551 domain-containing protein [Escherichia coli]HBA7913858.1 DUF551 domain-containing protein [Escherichia coli]HBA7918495.1 DUF551 domain-containing protein [Escherichia coli]HBA7988450.1 DUF551 domain-containing protein [Escherichia coli]HBA8056351.1 DUF551 domain-containing protein [Escherichia coli]
MSAITKERIKLFIKNPLDNGLTRGEQMELARIALASLEAEPIAWECGENIILFNPDTVEAYAKRAEISPKPLFAAPPVPVVPDARPSLNNGIVGFDEGWNACRAAMLHGAEPVSQTYKLNELSGNSPVTPDGWISCSERMPKKNQNVLISVNFDSDLVEPLICSARYTGSTFRRGDATIKPGNGIEQATHWMPLPEPPQEVK